MTLNWSNRKPTVPGAYWLRGFEYDKPAKKALVEVRKHGGKLKCNLHSGNSDSFNDGPRDWFTVSGLDPTMEWCGPLVPEASEA